MKNILFKKHSINPIIVMGDSILKILTVFKFRET